MTVPVDPDALAEALERYDNDDGAVVLPLVEHVFAAARVFLEAPTTWYCYTHEVATSDGLYETEFGSHEYDECKVGRVRLVAEETP